MISFLLGSQFKSLYIYSAPFQAGQGCAVMGSYSEVQSGSGSTAQQLPLHPASRRIVASTALASPQDRPDSDSPPTLVHKTKSPGPSAVGDPTRLFLTTILSKANHYVGNWELLCR